MLHFFRKIRRDLLANSQFFKYLKYAAGEIILVVLGILIALQINNWNENRKTEKEELKALKDLTTEFETNHEIILAHYEHKKEAELKMRTFISRIVSDSLTLNQKIQLERPDWSGFNLYANYTILNSLISSGKIERLDNDSLKIQLTQWIDLILYYKGYERRHNEQVVPFLTSIEHETVPSAVFPEVQEGGELKMDYLHPEATKDLRINLIGNLEYENSLIEVVNSLWINSQILEGMLDGSYFIQQELEKEIERKTY